MEQGGGEDIWRETSVDIVCNICISYMYMECHGRRVLRHSNSGRRWNVLSISTYLIL